ncbi:sugar phosphate isomerase/epimerase family protein [Lederbergia galactosidilytica]|uniref:Xylose isomerase n=1 Tax=Lederbergia galactosidilytica TaxID=217031 RepID=A0A178A2B6_9BACI|nr:sugar phosphate isomerase/epimerase family protein [Lederbergia galactosidilytica]KRG14444.1 xylose isomerase [Virgibacillus soli]MBP1914974.1 sugar phosphate isomerase/epimerase [Lederbergia galactosidilytica]OAK74252.1 xylose isomerase [Lederbergia galactosidilytica]
MKLAFTTLGCPEWNLDTIISKAVEFDYDGVDFRGYLGEMEIYKLPEFSSDIETTKRKFNEADLEIPCFSSSIRLFTTSNKELESFKEELRQYGRLCQEFNTPFIRVFGGGIGEISRAEAIDFVKNNLAELLPIAEQYGVTLILETHDSWTKCEYVENILRLTDSKHVQVLWDIHHPYRTEGEQPEKTWELLGDRIKYTHWKDSYPDETAPRGYQLCLMGEGDIPLKRILHLLKQNGYEGYYTLEWEKVWCPEIEEPEVAIPQYIQFMKQLKEE